MDTRSRFISKLAYVHGLSNGLSDCLVFKCMGKRLSQGSGQKAWIQGEQCSFCPVCGRSPALTMSEITKGPRETTNFIQTAFTAAVRAWFALLAFI